MKSSLNSLILNYPGFSFKFVSVTYKVFTTPSLQSAHCKPEGCCVAAAKWRPGGAAAMADVGCCAQQGREDVEHLLSS